MNKLTLAASASLLLLLGQTAMACPDYLNGEYRKLHSSDSVDLCKLTEDKVVLVVNTASHCGFVDQFKGLEALHEKYKDRGLVVVGFASDDFNQEDKDEAAAADICFVNFGVTFTMMAPTNVRGENANTLFKALAKQTQEPKWNFNKYLLSKDGKVVEYFGSTDKPESKTVIGAIEQLL